LDRQRRSRVLKKAREDRLRGGESGANRAVGRRGIAWDFLIFRNRREIIVTLFLPYTTPTFKIWVETSPLGFGPSITDTSLN
jgi:hypothetical protein